MKRSSGVLLHITSLPGRYGVGTLGNHARRFADFCHQAGLSWWQILPVGPAGNGNSPYQSDSVFAGNPDLIDLEQLIEWGLLKREECDRLDWGSHADEVCFEKLHRNQPQLLRLAFARAKQDSALWEQVQRFVAEQDWLDDYALYLALKQQMGGKPWQQWDAPLAKRDRQTLKLWKERLQEEMEYHCWVQYLFFEQWAKLKEYCNRKGVRLIGDIPIYVAPDSCDTWVNSRLFEYDEDFHPLRVAGCPPDYFSKTGQLWGNPLYRWDVQEKTDFAWWKERMKASGRLYDVVRIDHFIGVVQYYAIPAGAEDGRTGEWLKGPGKKLTDAIGQVIGDTKIIAEDLGIFVPEVKALLEETGYPGMKIIEFAFSGDRFNEHLPHMYTPNSVVYGGTHDNETLVGYFKPEERQWWELQYIADYMGVSHQDQVVDRVMFTAYGSVASVVIFQAQDVLKLDNWARMNTPGTVGSNWRWRMRPGELNQGHADHLAWLVDTFGRF